MKDSPNIGLEGLAGTADEPAMPFGRIITPEI